MHDICNLFGVALNRARHELGLTQVELAEKLGTTDRSISVDALIGVVPKGDVPSCVKTFFAGMSAEEAAKYIRLCKDADELTKE